MISINALMEDSGVAFGTSGARGLVRAMTDQVCFAYTTAFLQHLTACGEFAPNGQVALAGDLRPSSPRILAACIAAIRHLGGEPIFCGFTPTPALATYAFSRRIPSLMVTGSHIPDDRNGIKFNRAMGEILKADEVSIRAQCVIMPADLFDNQGMLHQGDELPPSIDLAPHYTQRYMDFFGQGALQGMKIGVYQHSAVGRDILTTLLQALGANVIPLGRSNIFVPVDTEAIRDEDVALARQWASEWTLDAIVSTDGDSDRPLVADERGEWMRGDVLGILCARYLEASYVCTPVSSNTALEKSGHFGCTARTRIGSPYVIAAMQEALAKGFEGVCGYEANGGFLLSSDVTVNGRTLPALPTRDAMIPILSALALAGARQCSVSGLSQSLPGRFTYSDRLRDFPAELSRGRLALLQSGSIDQQREALTSIFGSISGAVDEVDRTDGLRMTFANEEVIHLRPSGNAPELRCYTEANTSKRAAAVNGQAMNILSSWLRT